MTHIEDVTRLRELETEVFNLRHGSVLAQTSGEVRYSARLIQIIRNGGSWRSRDLLAELGINSSDADAIEIVVRQLQAMQDAGLVSETARGWKWTK